MTNKVKQGFWVLSDLTLLLALVIFLSDINIGAKSSYCYDDLNQLPEKKVGLVLGTAKYRIQGGINLYYKHRITAAAELYHSGKVRFLLVSGDNALREYDEPTTIKNDLVKAGVPVERIFLDYAGFRTFDSMIRCRDVFSERDIIVVSQQFHNERAIYIARHKGMQALGYNARDVGRLYGLKTMLREKLARTKTLLDVHVLNTTPKFLGDKIEIELHASEETATDI